MILTFSQGCYRTATTVITSLYAEMANVINVGKKFDDLLSSTCNGCFFPEPTVLGVTRVLWPYKLIHTRTPWAFIDSFGRTWWLEFVVKFLLNLQCLAYSSSWHLFCQRNEWFPKIATYQTMLKVPACEQKTSKLHQLLCKRTSSPLSYMQFTTYI